MNGRTLRLLTALLIITNFTMAQSKTIPLYEAGKIPNAKATTEKELVQDYSSPERKFTFTMKVIVPDLTVYLPAKDKNSGVGVIICPGGG